MATEIMTTSVGNSSMEENNEASSVDTEESRDIDKEQLSETWTKSELGRQAVSTNNQPKKTHRRKPSKKKRKWKPYSKMTWEERKALEEKEKSKAVRIREEMKEKGRPVAPYNTTQFLMDEHDPYDNMAFEPTGYNNSNVSTAGTDEGESYSEGDQDDMNGSIVSNDDGGVEDGAGYTDSPHMVPEFISQDFSETYERVHEESLNTMTRDELMTEHMELETKFNQLQEQLAKTKRSHSHKTRALEAKIEELESEKESLKSEVERLQNENDMLKDGKSESRMSTSDTEDVDSKSVKKTNTLAKGEVMERR